MLNRRNKRGALAAAALTVVLTLAACGQPGSGDLAETSGSTTATSIPDSGSAPSVPPPSLTVIPPDGGSASASVGPSSAPMSSVSSASSAPDRTTATSSTPATDGTGQGGGEDPTTTATSTKSTTESTRTSATKTSATKQTNQPMGHMTGKVVAIDPGHNGQNYAHPEIINQKIDGGNGFENVCNTTGTETNDGYPEHQFNWNVANYLKQELQAKGITVVMTRQNNDGVGPCTPKRAQIENDSAAAAVISIHADGEAAGVRGFYVITNGEPTHGQKLAEQSLSLGHDVRDALESAGFLPTNDPDLGENGMWTRADLTGLNLSTKPKILVELGNMRNAKEATVMSSADGQQRYAKALAAGTIAYLLSGGS